MDTRAATRRSMGLALLLATTTATLAQEVTRTPLPSSHPLVGTWKVEVPGTQCFEIYNIRADGTLRVVSGEQKAESEFDLSLEPSPKGFYKWVDKITQDNQKPDCMGSVMTVGHVATNYILLHRSGQMFLMCQTEALSQCVGPFVRQTGV